MELAFAPRTAAPAALLSVILLAACGPGPAAGPGAAVSRPPVLRSSTPGAAASASPQANASAIARPAAWPLVLPVPAVPAGPHQTSKRPPASGAVFHAEMTDLWAAIVSGRPKLALPAFFPLVAYKQVKAIADPAADWHNRLLAEFSLDLAAAHDFLGRQARHAVLIRVVVPEAEAAWIVPGVCFNGVGYWHVAGPRLVYRAGGAERSIGIASLISWRGLWYVVHLGAVLRSGAGGVVDQPAAGPGTPGPPGGC
jgi:hypothetical protein